MDFTQIAQFIEMFGFPIACVIALGIFVYKIYKDTNAANKENMAQVQARCAEREEKLYQEIEKNREVNAQAIATIAKYAEKLEAIQTDINEIKTDVIKITEKIG